MSRCVTGSVSVTRSYSTATAWSTTGGSTASASPRNRRAGHKASEKNNTKRPWHIDLRACNYQQKKPTI